MKTEFIRTLNINYERLLLDEMPEEKKYQYCILNRGGINGLLPCSLRYIDGAAYLYYDISSKQNMQQLFAHKKFTREQIVGFFRSLGQMRRELERFLLDSSHLLLFPNEIFQDLDSKTFYFLYVPYFEGDRGCRQLLSYFAENLEYSDEQLVETVYQMYERLEECGDVYFESEIFQDVKRLEEKAEVKAETPVSVDTMVEEKEQEDEDEPKRGRFSFFEGRRKKKADGREEYRKNMKSLMEGRAVADEPSSAYGDQDYSRTLYIEETAFIRPNRELCLPDGKVLMVMEKDTLVIGKRRGEVDLVLDEPSVSRVHARIVKEGEEYYLEDLNSTNLTFKNGLQLQPYEKKLLESGDEIRVGRVLLMFR